jgi:hypothetical protein|tara:strand:+ start:297 stop:422 length:126 start_codon:yes stop_codon:yes gene_type:complete
MDNTKGLIFGTPAAITRYIASNGASASIGMRSVSKFFGGKK